MKKLFFLSLLLFYQVGFSQQITLVQYWFGGNFTGRATVAVTANANNEIIFDIEFPDNGSNELNEYFHCRFRDSDDNWSAIYSQQMSNNNDASTSQVKVQYWFDANSPIGRPEVTINNILVNGELDYQELDIPWPTGAQEIHYRFKSSYNKWSSIQSSNVETTVYQNNQITKVEYWFGDGFAARGEPEAVTANANNEIILNISYPDDDINQLDTMVHYRFLDGIGNWSCIYSEQMVTQNTSVGSEVKVQYWFDDNFNPTNTLQLLTNDANGNQINSLPIVWETDAQTIHYRFRSKYNQWTSIQSTNIDEIENRDNKIVELEWWLNNGFADKDTILVNQTGDAFLDTRDLTLDPAIQNTIHVRYKDKMNRWSSIFSFFPTEPGITVLVHGFQALGGLTDSTADFKKMGASIINRAGGGVMFINNQDTGNIEIVENTGGLYDYELNYSKEIVLVYDWRSLSNNNLTNTTFGGNGYLEAAADNLFATFLNLPELSEDQILAKPMHFIAHSRGNILTLQFLHRLATYFPEVKVNQFTLLDPHPATSFGDLNTEVPISPPNLPCVYGVGTNCGLAGCLDGNSVFLRIPFNVQSADNYYRTDEYYEGYLDFGAFDGVRVPSLGNFNRELNDTVLDVGAPGIGGTHSAVHLWYRGTINRNENVAYPTTHQFGAETIIDITAEENTTNWYLPNLTSTIINNDFMQYENRFITGFNQSRIGGGTPVPLLEESEKESILKMDQDLALRYGLSLTDFPNGVKPHTVNGGYFDSNNYAGWIQNGGLSTNILIENGKAQIPYDATALGILKHSMMYFSDNYNFLKINIYDALFCSIKITFFNSNNNQIGMPIINVLNNGFSEQYFQIPNQLKGEVGTFQIEYLSNNYGSFKVDKIKLVEFDPNGDCGNTTIWAATTENSNGSWSNGIPLFYDNAIISHDLTLNENIEACTLTINNNANVIIEEGFYVKLNGAIKVNSGTFTLNNNASLIQNSTEFPNVGAITVKRNTNALMRLDYTMWSSPVENQSLIPFSPYTLTNRFYTYNPNNNFYETIPNLTNTSFANANGYLIRMPNNHPTVPTIWNGEFTGVPHNGRFELNVTDGSYNAIGNPYPSPIKADLFIEENNLTEAIYFWRKTNNSLNPSYACYTLMGGTGTKANIGGGSDIVPNGIIQTGQGFIAKATSNKLTFTNAMRFANNENQFFRTNQEKSRIWLNLTNPNDFFCQTMIGYMPNATNEFDAAIDGHFLENEPTKLGSLIGNQEFVIQGRAPFDVSDVVPLCFRSAIAGNYTIAIDNKDGLFVDGQEIYLKDNLLNNDHVLSNEPYSFNTESGIFNSRFEIHYQPTLSIQNSVFSNNVIVYKQNENITVDSSKENIKNVKVYDLRGRLLKEIKNVTQKAISFAVETANQVLIVKVLTDDELITTKKIIN